MTADSRCATPYCNRPTRYVHGRYCESCRTAKRANGAAKQKCVKKADLRRYVTRAKRLMARRNQEKILDGLRVIHSTLLAVTEEGSSSRFVRQAHTGLAKALNESDPLACGLTVASLALLRVHNPRQFPTERTWEFALVRTFRSQVHGSMAYGTTWNHQEQRAKLWFKRWPERTTEYAALLLKEAYVPFIAAMLSEDKREASARAAIREGFEEPCATKKRKTKLAPRGSPRKPLGVSPLGTPAQTTRRDAT